MPITFAVEAENMISAIDFARTMPGVKHDHPNVILDAHEITLDEFNAMRMQSAYERMYANDYKRKTDRL